MSSCFIFRENSGQALVRINIGIKQFRETRFRRYEYILIKVCKKIYGTIVILPSLPVLLFFITGKNDECQKNGIFIQPTFLHIMM